METQRNYLILTLISIFFVVLFIYFLQDRYYHLEKFSSLAEIKDSNTIQPIPLDNTTLDEYKSTWTNASIIANKSKLILKDKIATGFIYEKPRSTVEGVTVHNMDWKAYFEEYPDLAINGLPYNKQSAYNHYYNQSVKGSENRFVNKLFLWNEIPNKPNNVRFSLSYWIYINNPSVNWQLIFHLGRRQNDHLVPNWGDRHPGIWLWPNQPVLHVRQNIGIDWNSGTGTKEPGEWNKEYERQALALKLPYFITHVFDNDKTTLYVNGAKHYEHSHQNPPTPLLDNVPTYISVGQQLPITEGDYSYVLKDINIYVDPLSSSQVAQLYESRKDDGGNGDEARKAIQQDSTSSSSEGFQVLGSQSLKRYSSTVETESFISGSLMPPLVKNKLGYSFQYDDLEPVQKGGDVVNAEQDYTTAGSTPTGPKKEVLLEKSKYALTQDKTLKYIDFNANNKQYYIDLTKINKHIRFSKPGGASFAFWIKHDTTKMIGKEVVFVMGLENGWFVICIAVGKSLTFNMNHVSQPKVSITVQNMNIGDWVHVAWVIRNNEEKSWDIYINGVKHITETGKMAMVASGMDTSNPDYNVQTIGSLNERNIFTGYLGDFQIYEGELNEEQVKIIGGRA
jgi:hypothetical protein